MIHPHKPSIVRVVFDCVVRGGINERILQGHDNQQHFDEETVEAVRKNFYVDDCLKSVQSEQDAVRLTGQLRDLLAKGGYTARAESLNQSRYVRERVPSRTWILTTCR